jgi:hypothetical protein
VFHDYNTYFTTPTDGFYAFFYFFYHPYSLLFFSVRFRMFLLKIMQVVVLI